MVSPSGKKTSPSKPLDEDVKIDTSTGLSLLSSGKRHLLVSAIPLAVSDLAESCEILSKVFGETGEECAESYLYYGKALLELSRLESRVLGNALDGVDMDAEDSGDASMVEDPEKMTKDEKIEVEDKVAEALEENFETHDRIARTHFPGQEDLEMEDGSAMDQDSQDEEGDKAPNEDQDKVTETEEKAEDMEDEDPSNLQLAWEMLELAKVVYSKTAEAATGDKKKELVAKLCESYLGLGEVSLENENYTQAVADLTECLDMRKANLPADSRSIAESHYQLGVAQALHGKFEDAELCLNSAITVLETRIANLAKMETSHNISKEVSELEALVAEIKEKIGDHKNMEKTKIEVAESSKTGFSGSLDKPVSSIGIKRSVDLTAAKDDGSSTVGSA